MDATTMWFLVAGPLAVLLAVGAPLWYRRWARRASDALARWSTDHGFEPAADDGVVTSMLTRFLGASRTLDGARRGGTTAHTVLVRAGRHTNEDLQVARAALRHGPSIRLVLDTTAQGNAIVLAPLLRMADVRHVKGVDARLDRRWVVLADADEAERAHTSLQLDPDLVSVLAGVEAPAWCRRAGDGPWAIDLHPAIAGRLTPRLTVAVEPDAVTVAARGRRAEHREAVVQLAEQLAAAIDDRSRSATSR